MGDSREARPEGARSPDNFPKQGSHAGPSFSAREKYVSILTELLSVQPSLL